MCALYLKSLSNIQSFLKYSHVYLYLNHSNSLSNDTFLSWKVGVYVVENYVQMYISLALFKPNKKKYLYCNWRISKVSTSWSLCKNKNKTSLCCRGCRAMPSQKGDAQSKLKPRKWGQLINSSSIWRMPLISSFISQCIIVTIIQYLHINKLCQKIHPTFVILISERSECQSAPGFCTDQQICLSNGRSGLACLCGDNGKIPTPQQLMHQLQHPEEQLPSNEAACQDVVA